MRLLKWIAPVLIAALGLGGAGLAEARGDVVSAPVEAEAAPADRAGEAFTGLTVEGEAEPVDISGETVDLYQDPVACIDDAAATGGEACDAAFGVMAANYDDYGNDTVFTINGKQVSAGMVPDVGNCWRWAQNMYKIIWGCQFNSEFAGTSGSGHNLLRKLGDAERKLTPEHLKRFVAQTKPGATIRVCGCTSECPAFENDGLSCGHKGHSLIIADMNADGVVTMDSFSGTQHTRFYSWQGFCNAWQSYGYVKYIKWPGAPALAAEKPVEVVKTVAVTGVTLDRQNVLLLEGESASLCAAVIPADATDQRVKWNSSDAAVASVKGGRITGRACGTATITVRTKDGAHLETCLVKVLPAQGTKRLTRTGSNGTVKLCPGQALTLVPTFATQKGWKIKAVRLTDENVARIDGSGVLTALSDGETTLGVLTKNGKRATLTIRVIDPLIPTKVTLSKSSVTMKRGTQLKLYAKLSPVTAVGKLTWKTSNANVAEVDAEGNVTARGKGACYVGAITENGKYARAKVRVY